MGDVADDHPDRYFSGHEDDWNDEVICMDRDDPMGYMGTRHKREHMPDVWYNYCRIGDSTDRAVYLMFGFSGSWFPMSQIDLDSDKKTIKVAGWLAAKREVDTPGMARMRFVPEKEERERIKGACELLKGCVNYHI